VGCDFCGDVGGEGLVVELGVGWLVGGECAGGDGGGDFCGGWRESKGLTGEIKIMREQKKPVMLLPCKELTLLTTKPIPFERFEQ